MAFEVEEKSAKVTEDSVALTLPRVRWKRGADAHEDLILLCKGQRIRDSEERRAEEAEVEGPGSVDDNVLKLVATVPSLDDPVLKHIT